jgi:hypothetical protein
MLEANRRFIQPAAGNHPRRTVPLFIEGVVALSIIAASATAGALIEKVVVAREYLSGGVQ